MGAAEEWQSSVIKSLSEYDELVIFNPRRDDWDSSWTQRMSDPNFKEQVDWELNMLDICDMIVMYFDPATKSPISLLELGLYAQSKKLQVICPDSFWKKGNVEVVCERYGIDLYNSLPEFINGFHALMEE